ncbi:DNA polymerase III subunit alpha [Streptacidiphilus sp. PB12-B1b]|uniref:DNA polymerase III subunit alpha n=1 Tax=Streptacidiphilus sp. PB12-B1b TaxID=2705012 RepID=UPI001CDB4BD6|nr:DNA polymerase III subunit alpha [Streptacidiphilus sp. PB12-B1b]
MFTHLQVASGYSVRFGASHPDALVRRAAGQGMAALALTDRDTVAGAVRFAKACAEVTVRPVFGADLAVAAFEQPRSTASGRRTPARGGAFVDESAPRVTLLARDRAGWAALCALLTAAHADPASRRPLLPWSALEQADGDGLTVLLGPDSEPLRALAAGRPDRAAALLAPWRQLFEGRLRLAAVALHRGDAGPGSLRLAARTVGLAADLGIEAVLSNAVRYADPAQAPIADVLDAARRLLPIDERHRDRGQRWLKPEPVMALIAEHVAAAAGQEHGGAARLLAATERTAQQCRVDPYADLGLTRPEADRIEARLPEPGKVGAERRPAYQVLRSRTVTAMLRRGYHRDGSTRRRLEDELRIIRDRRFETYFLTVAAVVDDARDLGIRTAARGSSAGSLVVHLLGIASANPMEHGLLMERFLSRHRRALPDIDIDVESARRLEVYRAAFARFGAERVAAVAMPETYRVRHAIRDAGAALGIDPDELGRLAKAFPHIRARDVRAAMAELPELRAVAADADRYGPLWDLVEGLDALPRGTAMHPCGLILSDDSLLRRTPVLPTPGEGLPMSVFDKEDVEDLGLLKLDVLGVRMQSAMAHAVTEIARTTDHRIDLDDPAQVPPDDPATFELIRSSQTLGCFQIESPGQRELIGRLQPEHFHDLVVDISLFRPGPVAADMISPFIEARHGRRRPYYPHPELRPALEGTLGVVVFNEQVMQILQVMTGCDLGRGDVVRRTMSDKERLPGVEHWFRQQARAKGHRPEVVDEVWGILLAMASYGFAKAHAVAFAVPTYQSAWLKTHHPAAFYAGLLTHDPGMYPARLLLADARRRGVPILPLDVQHSAADYRTEPVETPQGRRWGVRLALSGVQGISAGETARIAAGQPYGSVSDWFTRARPALPVAERLARIGALASLAPGLPRRDLLLQVTELHRQQRSTAVPTQLTLAAHSTDAGPDAAASAGTGLPVMTAAEELGAELSVLGLDVSRHLMTDHHRLLAELGVIPAHRLAELETGAQVLVAGAKVANQTPPNRTGRRILFATLDDGTGLVDLAFFDDAQHCAHTVFHSFLLVVRGAIARRGPRSLSVVGAQAWNLADLAAARETGGLDAVRRLLTAAPDTAAPDAGGPQPPHRVLTLPSGYTLAPWADLQPAGEGTAATRKLWTSSPGSAG